MLALGACAWTVRAAPRTHTYKRTNTALHFTHTPHHGFGQGDESRALKVMKLEGLRQELAMHEETAAQLRRMIADMEAELGQGS